MRHEDAVIYEESFKDEFLLKFSWFFSTGDRSRIESCQFCSSQHGGVLSENEIEEHWDEEAALFNSIRNVEEYV